MHTIPLKSQPYTIKDRTNLSRVLSEATTDLYDHVEMLNLQGSGFSMTQALSVDIQISRVLGVRHGCQMIPFSKTQRAIKSIRSINTWCSWKIRGKIVFWRQWHTILSRIPALHH